ncbi:MAG: FAD-dependent oxidoreductase [Acidobacteria bacterium]|nr:FAD-dependent oxidoreductase [Acidobacteriota bacterium]
MKTWDVILVGGGIIGLSLAIALHKRGVKVLIVEKSEPGREASSAAAGMLEDYSPTMPEPFQKFAALSARMYPEFVHELQDESGIHIDLRDDGAIFFPEPNDAIGEGALPLPAPLSELEASLAGYPGTAYYLKERSVDPRALVAAALKAAKHRQVDLVTGSAVIDIVRSGAQVTGVRTERSAYAAPVVVNCAGAWAGEVSPLPVPTRPVKGQMLALVGMSKGTLRHVVRSKDGYLVPRSDGRLVIGATMEEAGYDKRTEAATIQRMHQAAVRMVPALAQARVVEAWAGLRPGTPDNMPILGATRIEGYFVATGHFRDGILLTPATAKVMAQLITGNPPEFDLTAFSPARFG